MEKSVDKFINYLESKMQSVMRKLVEKAIINQIYEAKEVPASLDWFINREAIDDYIWKESKKKKIEEIDEYIFYGTILDLLKKGKSHTLKLLTDYRNISVALMDSNLKAKEKAEVLDFILRDNLAQIGENAVLLDMNKLREIIPGNLSDQEIEEYLKENLFLEDSEVNAKILQGIKDQTLLDPDFIALRIIKNRYINQLDNLQEKELKIISLALQKVKVSKELCDIFLHYVRKSMPKENKKSEAKVNEDKENFKEEDNLSPRKYKKLMKEVQTNYYNIEEQKVIRTLSMEEIIYLISLLYKLHISESEIRICVGNLYKAFENQENNPFINFNFYYEKMLHYSDNEKIRFAIQYIKNGISTCFLPRDLEEYITWKKDLQSVLEETKPLLRDNYDYELQAGKDFVSKR